MTSIKAVFLDLDGTLYDNSILAEQSRRNAVRAMIEAGLPAGEDDAYRRLLSIVEKHGSNYDNHYDKLVSSYGIKRNKHVVAAGVVAYHTTKLAYLVPYRETVPTLLRLHDMGLKLGVVTNGLAVKQWEKIIRLGLQHFFHTAVISEDVKAHKPDKEIFEKAAKKINVKPDECMMVGDRIEKDFAGANKLGFTTVFVARGEEQKPKKKIEEPDYIISDLSALPEIVRQE